MTETTVSAHAPLSTQTTADSSMNIKPYLIGAIVVLAVVGITALLYSQKETRQQEAAALLFQSEKLLSDEAATVEKEKKSGEAAVLFPKALESFKSVTQKYAGTRAAFEAQLKLGDLYLEKGPKANAIPFYEAADQAAPKKFEKMLANYSLGYAFESAQQFPKAIDAFKKALSMNEGLKGELLLAIARNQTLAGTPDQARATYDQMIKDLGNSPFAKEAEIRKARLQ